MVCHLFYTERHSNGLIVINPSNFWGSFQFLSLFVFFCPFLSRLSPGLDNGATSFIPLHRESDKDSCNLLTDHIKQNVKLNS